MARTASRSLLPLQPKRWFVIARVQPAFFRIGNTSFFFFCYSMLYSIFFLFFFGAVKNSCAAAAVGLYNRVNLRIGNCRRSGRVRWKKQQNRQKNQQSQCQDHKNVEHYWPSIYCRISVTILVTDLALRRSLALPPERRFPRQEPKDCYLIDYCVWSRTFL